MAIPFAPSDLDFSDFMSKLIGEVFDSVISSQLDQQKRHRETSAALDWDDEAFAQAFIGENLVDEELANLFPRAQADQPHAVLENGPYQPREAEGGEQPPFSRLLDLSLQADTDFAPHPTGDGWVLLAAGVARVRKAVRMLLAAQTRAGLHEIYRRGAPRVVVDSGKILAKLAYEVKTENTQQISTQTPSVSGRRTFSSLSGNRAVAPAQGLRLAVRQANDRTVRNESQASLYGEVSLQFRTVA